MIFYFIHHFLIQYLTPSCLRVEGALVIYFVYCSCVWGGLHLISPQFRWQSPLPQFPSRCALQPNTNIWPRLWHTAFQGTVQKRLVVSSTGTISANCAVVPGGSPGAGTILCLVLKIVLGRMIHHPCFWGFPRDSEAYILLMKRFFFCFND